MKATKLNSNDTKNGFHRHLWRAALTVMAMMVALASSATAYVTMNDGRLLVFPTSCIKSMSTSTTEVTFTALDGTTYSYPRADILSIDYQLPKTLPTFTSFKFNNKYNHQVVSDAVGIITDDEVNVTVAGIGKWLTASFGFSDANATAWVNDVEQHSTVNRFSFAQPKVYTVGFPGDSILYLTLKGKYAFKPYGRQYTVNVDFLTDHSTRVPRIDINTVNGENITSKEYYLDAEIIIDGAGVFPSMTDSVQIKGRGNTSWSNNPDTKNPYRLKFANKVKPLGLTKGKNWVLIANKMIASMLTNAIGMKAASLLGTEAANHIIPVDLYINGTYKGSYNFTEKIGFSNNSVDIDDESAAALLELDTHYDEADGQKFYSAAYHVPVNVKEPEFADSTTLLTLNDIKRRVNGMINAIYYKGDMPAHVDIESAARYTMLNELILNYEILQPKSVFCYNENILDDNSKFIFGPVWDFDWAFGFSSHRSYYSCDVNEDFYTALPSMHQYLFINMRYNEQISQRMYELWGEFINNGLGELYDYCKEYCQYALPSFNNNKQPWHDNTNYENQASRAANWLRDRAHAIYNVLRFEHADPGDVDGDGVIGIDDITALIDHILNSEATTVSPGADVDNNGIISIDDVTVLIDMLLGS